MIIRNFKKIIKHIKNGIDCIKMYLLIRNDNFCLIKERLSELLWLSLASIYWMDLNLAKKVCIEIFL